jgi:hypothetical protein
MRDGQFQHDEIGQTSTQFSHACNLVFTILQHRTLKLATGKEFMQYIFPLATLALFIVLLLRMPWRHTDPKHQPCGVVQETLSSHSERLIGNFSAPAAMHNHAARSGT